MGIRDGWITIQTFVHTHLKQRDLMDHPRRNVSRGFIKLPLNLGYIYV